MKNIKPDLFLTCHMTQEKLSKTNGSIRKEMELKCGNNGNRSTTSGSKTKQLRERVINMVLIIRI
jgi:hypothetical protein